MGECKHQVGYKQEQRKVTVRGLVDDVPFGVEISADDRTAKWIDTNMRPASKVKRVADPAIDENDVPADGKKCSKCKGTLKKLIRGGIGWAKDALGVDRVPLKVARERQAICEGCEFHDFGVCRDDWPDKEQQGCGCILSLKVLQASEECPHKKWLTYAD